MTQNNLLEDLLKRQSQSRASKQMFTLNVMYLGAPLKAHYPKQKDAHGKTLKDSNGNAVHAEFSDGDTYTFSEVGTSKVVKIVYAGGILMTPGVCYQVTGLGYDMRASNMIFIDEDTSIQEIMEV